MGVNISKRYSYKLQVWDLSWIFHPMVLTKLRLRFWYFEFPIFNDFFRKFQIRHFIIFIIYFTNLQKWRDIHSNTWIKHDKTWIRHHCYTSGVKSYSVKSCVKHCGLWRNQKLEISGKWAIVEQTEWNLGLFGSISTYIYRVPFGILAFKITLDHSVHLRFSVIWA